MSQMNDGSRSRQRIRKPAPALDIPDIHENAAERKRILNVLAQRRYRQRKREARLAARAEGLHQRLTENQAELEGDASPCSADETNPQRGSHETLDEQQPSSEHLTFPLDSTTLSNVGNFNKDELQLLSATSPYYNIGSDTFNPDHTIRTSPSLADDYTFGDGTSSIASSSTTFPDSYFLQVPPLTLLRGLFRIAMRLNAASSVFSLTSISPFNLGLGPDPSEIPPAWRPTAAQLSVPHHPVLDLFPWPPVRDRLIEVLSLTEQSAEIGLMDTPRLVNFIYDMEDAGEGIRIWGSDPYDETHWEVGQVLYERWWFVFDRSTVEQSNYLRIQRGAAPLRASQYR
ncbi:uncharacterized protein P884DRAFT_213103 [Thermothelomyces heterothallicus CBS 202.75]|uniref:uncharacterized protein n=1 Tax=Thermothelomyces heterothallicus CBS 202.75 TaxID=1149848 RepID=UPI003741F87F